jgi:hypothetical protein
MFVDEKIVEGGFRARDVDGKYHYLSLNEIKRIESCTEPLDSGASLIIYGSDNETVLYFDGLTALAIQRYLDRMFLDVMKEFGEYT